MEFRNHLKNEAKPMKPKEQENLKVVPDTHIRDFKMKKYFYHLFWAFTFCLFPVLTFAQIPPSVGSGSENDPYQISTSSHLIWLSNLVMSDATTNYSVTNGMYLVLINDINMTGQSFTPIGGWSNATTDTSSRRFAGNFNGNGNKITNLTINKPSNYYVGLFGSLHSTATVANLGVDGSITGRSYVAGIVGYNNAGSISNCYATGTVSCNDGYVGGIVGYNNTGSVINCYATSSVSATGQTGYAGGLIGYSSGIVSNCYATGSVSGLGAYAYLGGLIGYSYFDNVSNSYATSSISATSGDYVGGLIGRLYGTVSNCYSAPSVISASDVPTKGVFIGYYENGSIANCYYSLDLALPGLGTSSSPGLTGKTNSNLKAATMSAEPGSEGNSLNYNNPVPIWRQDNASPLNNGFPILAWQTGAVGTVSYDLNNGTGTPPATQTLLLGSVITLNTGTGFNRIGYTFADWNSQADGSGIPYQGSMSIIDETSLTLYAQWTANTYTITFDLDGGAGTPTTQTVTYGQVYGTLLTPTKTGYTFDGWFTEIDGGGTQITSTTIVNITAAQTLYAKWTAKTYTVTFDPDGGAVSPTSATVTYDSTYGELPIPTKTGYNFLGWFTAINGGGTQVLEITNVTITTNQTLYAQWRGGTGTNIDPYLIHNTSDLQWLSDLVMNDATANYSATNGKYFKLMNDIDMSGQAFTPIGGWSDAETNSSSCCFAGNFDGNDNKIINLIINKPSNTYLGLFGYTYSSAVITNLGVNCVLTGNNYVGGLIGYNSGTVKGCFATGSLSSSSSRFNTNCYNYAGGLIGYNSHGTITNCYTTVSTTSTATITTTGYQYFYGYSYAGGLIGYNLSGKVANCYTTGSSSSFSYLTSSISHSAEGLVYAGGLIGYNSSGNIMNCYATGAVNSSGSSNVSFIQTAYAGGLVGYMNNGTISHSYAAPVSISADSYKSGVLTGNCSSGSSFLNCYHSSALNIAGNGNGYVLEIAKTNAQLQSESFVDYYSATVDNSLNYENPIPMWRQDDVNLNNGFPILAWQKGETAVTISYDINSGTGATPAPHNNIPIGNTIILDSGADFANTGFIFTGWNTKNDGSGISFSKGSSIIGHTTMLLYAQWSSVAGIAETIDIQGITVYNHDNIVYIKNKENLYLKSVQIISAAGQVLYNGQTHGDLNIETNVIEGMYIVRIISEDNRVVCKKLFL